MNYKMRLGKTIYALVGIVCAVTFASIILNILILCNVGRLVNSSTAVTGTSLACSMLLFGVCILLLKNTKYTLKDDNLIVNFGFWSIKFPYQNILGVAKETTLKKLYIQYSAPEKNGGFGVFAINILESEFDGFIDELLKHNKDIQILNTTSSK